MKNRSVKWPYVFFIFILVFPINLFIGHSLNNNNIFDRLDTLFNIDIPTRHNLFADGRGGDGLSLMHPNLYLVHAPVRLISIALKKGGITDDASQTRRDVAMLVSPFVAAITAIVIFLLLTSLNILPSRSILVSLFAAYSFSGLIFGSITDHFIFGGLSIALTLWLAVKSINSRRLKIAPWVLAGVFVASITVTNFAIFAIILFLMTVMYKDLDRGPQKSIIISVLALVITFSLHFAVAFLKNGEFGLNQSSYGTVQLNDFLHFSSEHFMGMPFALINSISPAGYISLLDSFGELIFTFEGAVKMHTIKILPGLLALGLIIISAVAGLRSSKKNIRYLTYVALLIITFNLVFHLFWGHEYFLYSQHWNTALFILLAGILFSSGKASQVATAFASVLLVSVLINNLTIIWNIQSDYQELNPRLDQVVFDCERGEKFVPGVFLSCK